MRVQGTSTGSPQGSWASPGGKRTPGPAVPQPPRQTAELGPRIPASGEGTRARKWATPGPGGAHCAPGLGLCVRSQRKPGVGPWRRRGSADSRTKLTGLCHAGYGVGTTGPSVPRAHRLKADAAVSGGGGAGRKEGDRMWRLGVGSAGEVAPRRRDGWALHPPKRPSGHLLPARHYTRHAQGICAHCQRKHTILRRETKNPRRTPKGSSLRPGQLVCKGGAHRSPGEAEP